MKARNAPAPDRAAERHLSLSRRRFLRGLGACLALPALESLGPAGALGAGASPLRMAFVYFPNGAIQDSWWPTGEGADFKLASTMEPLSALKDKLQVLGGLDHYGATPGPDGPGDHARASGSFLTGVRVRKTAGADIRAATSIDQLVAQRTGHLTRFPSLELTCDAVRKSGSCDSGYSCAYQYNLAWSSPTTPVAPEPNPRLVFERLFGGGPPGERADQLRRRQQQERSILDFVIEDAKSLARQLPAGECTKLDEYLTSVRAVEKRIAAAERFGRTPDPGVDTPAGIPPSFEEHVRLMYQLMVLAFQTDSTRVATFLTANDGSNRPFPELNLPEGHHYLTHHRSNPEMMSKVSRIDQWYARQFAWFLGELDRHKDADGASLLHNSMIVYGCGNSDGNRHTHVNLPIILAGAGGGKLSPGRFVKHGGVPMCNLFLTMADHCGAAGLERFGDSTARLKNV